MWRFVIQTSTIYAVDILRRDSDDVTHLRVQPIGDGS